MLDFFVYLVYRASFALVAVLPLPVLAAVGRVLGFGAWLLLPGYRRLALRNVAIAFGREKSPSDLRRLVRRHFQRLGANLLSGLKLAAMPLEEVRARVTIENADAAHRELRGGRPVVFVLSHIGNWELQAQMFPAAIGYVRNSTIYQALRNPYIDKHIRRLRGRAGVELFDRREGFQKPIELLRGGGAIGVLSDQHAGDQGLWVPFFGKLASTSSLPALLTKRTGAALLGTAIYTEGSGRWRMAFANRINEPEDSVEALTAKMNDLIATQIRRAPEDGFWLHNRWKTPRPNFLLSRYKRGVYVPDQISPKDLQPFRILVRASNWLGDAVMSVPAVQAIKQGRPDAYLTIVTPEKIAAMWKLLPEVDEVIPIRPKSLFATVMAIRQRPKFDIAVLFPNSLRVALEAWLGGVPRRVGYRGHCRSWLVNQLVGGSLKPGPIEHQSIHYLRIARDLGADVEETPASARLPALKFQPSNGPQPATEDKPLKLGLCPGAEYGPAKRWPVEHFTETAVAVAAQRQVDWVLFGTAKDAPLANEISRALENKCANRIGQTNLEQLIAELRNCRLLLTNDTGTMHLAALLGVPAVAIFGSTEPGLTGPLGHNNIVLRHQVECSPCFLRECPIDFRCMKAVTVQETIAAVLSLLDNQSIPSARR